MAVRSTAVTVTDVATRLDFADDARTAGGRLADPSGAQSIAVYNNGDDPIYLGGPDVTVANGVPVAAGAWGPGLDMSSAEGLYGIAADAGEIEVRVLEVNV